MQLTATVTPAQIAAIQQLLTEEPYFADYPDRLVATAWLTETDPAGPDGEPVIDLMVDLVEQPDLSALWLDAFPPLADDTDAETDEAEDDLRMDMRIIRAVNATSDDALFAVVVAGPVPFGFTALVTGVDGPRLLRARRNRALLALNVITSQTCETYDDTDEWGDPDGLARLREAARRRMAAAGKHTAMRGGVA